MSWFGGESQGETGTQKRRDKERVRETEKQSSVQSTEKKVRERHKVTKSLRAGWGEPSGVERHGQRNVRWDTQGHRRRQKFRARQRATG